MTTTEPTMVAGDPAAALLADLHERAELSGYSRVRLDRGMDRHGAWYELGYSYGEIKVRLSDRPDYTVVKIEPNVGELFETALYHNTARAKLTAAQAKKGRKK